MALGCELGNEKLPPSGFTSSDAARPHFQIHQPPLPIKVNSRKGDLDSTPVQSQSMRRTEFGIMPRRRALTCVYLFETNPIWLLAFTPTTLKKIYLSDFNDFSSFFNHFKNLQL